MNNKKIFGMDVAEIERICSKHPVSVDRNSPINKGEYLDPCIRGAEKIIKDNKKLTLMRKIYRGK